MKVIITTGFGRLHLVESAKALAQNGLNVVLLNGWMPGKRLYGVINFLGRVVLKRIDFSSSFKKREVNGYPNIIVEKLTIPEFLHVLFGQLSNLFFKDAGKFNYFTWRLYGFFSKKHINKSMDVFHVRSGAGQGGAIRKAQKKGLKVVVDHSIAHPQEIYNQLKKVYTNEKDHKRITIKPDSKFWQQVLKDCQEGDAILVNSDYVKESFVQNGFSSHKISIIPLGVRKEFWSLKEDYSIQGGVIKLLFTGGFGIRKGALLLLSAFKELELRGIQCSLDIVGKVQNDFDMPNWVMDHPNINLHGFLPQERLFQFLKESDLYVFPSYSEGAAQSLKEAMAAGVPVIATKQSGAPINDGYNGLLIKDNSVEEIVRAVQNLSSDIKQRELIGKNASKTISDKHTWENYAENLDALFKRLKGNSK